MRARVCVLCVFVLCVCYVCVCVALFFIPLGVCAARGDPLFTTFDPTATPSVFSENVPCSVYATQSIDMFSPTGAACLIFNIILNPAVRTGKSFLFCCCCFVFDLLYHHDN
jgi:hypothetical protein